LLTLALQDFQLPEARTSSFRQQAPQLPHRLGEPAMIERAQESPCYRLRHLNMVLTQPFKESRRANRSVRDRQRVKGNSFKTRLISHRYRPSTPGDFWEQSASIRASIGGYFGLAIRRLHR
jgi:hypothetical protein